WAESVRLRAPYKSEFRIRKASDGSFRSFRVTANPVFGEGGQLARWYGIADDIEDLKLAQARADDEERKLASVLGVSPAAIGIFSGPENRCVFANAKFLELLGAPGSPLGVSLEDLVSDPSHQILLNLVGESQRTNLPLHRLDLRLNQGGIEESAQVRHFHFFAHPINYREHGLSERVVYLRDISEQRRADERLVRSERKFRRLFSSNLLGIVFWNVHGEITEVNRPFQELLGYRADELLGSPLSRLTAPEYTAQDAREREMLSVQEHTVPTEKELVKKDGSRVTVVGGSGWISRTSGDGFSLVLDRTELKRSGEERARLQGRADSEKEASRLKSQFLANMSHEIRTPLHAILGFAKFLNESNLDEEQRAHARSLARAGENLLHLTNDILDLSRIEAKAVRLDLTTLNPLALVYEVVEMVRAAHPKAVPIRVSTMGPLPNLRGDPVRLGQIFTNILGNAAKFTHAGQIEVELRSEEHTGGHSELLFLCRDSGVGIDQESLARLFMPFAQGDASQGRNPEGSGLGLWISRNLAELMGGTLELESQLGQGTTVSVRLLLPKSLEKLAPDSWRAPPPVGSLNGVKVLVAEDNEMNQLIAEKLLTRAGCIVTVAQTGEEALRDLSTASFDLMLLDCQLPDIDGYTVARALRTRETREGRPSLPILAVTADAMGDSERRCAEAGMDDYISKPFDHGVFLAKIQNLLGQTGKDPDQATPAPSLDTKALKDLWDIDGEGGLLGDLMGIFSANMPERLDRLETSAKASRIEEVLQELHTLRACFGSVGLKRAAETCRGLEERIGTREFKAEMAEIYRVRDEFECGQEKLAHWKKAYPPTLKEEL
ncbi:MAG: response regulator, partial [Proteobacteria bacterium]